MTIGPEGAPDPQIVEFAISAVVALLEPAHASNTSTTPTTASTTPTVSSTTPTATSTPQPAAATPRGVRIRNSFPLLTDLLYKRIEALQADGAEDRDSDLLEARRLLQLLGAPPARLRDGGGEGGKEGK